MKTLRMFGMALLTIIFLNCCSDLKPDSSSNQNLSIRPVGIDLDGVTGFVIVDNAANTRAEGEQITTVPQSIYSIDENGNVKLSIFYFEVITSEDKNGNITQAQIQKEISEALQVVPSLVTDLGKYILFSSCNYQINDLKLSDEALQICKTFIQENYRPNMVYMIRKSDGALFDLSNQPIFSYYAFFNDSHYHFFPYYENHYDFISHSGVRWPYIPSYTYVTSTNNNLFVRGAEPVAVYSIEDNGDAIDVKKKTQDYGNSDFGLIQRFAVDKDENIYAFNRGDGLHIYYANGGFNFYKFEPSSSVNNLDLEVLDLLYDESGVPYIFLISNYHRDIEEILEDGSTFNRTEVGQLVMSACLNNGTVEPMSENLFWTYDFRDHYNFDSTERHYYLGYYDNCYNWCLRHSDDTKPNPICAQYKILSYDINTHNWTLRDVSGQLIQTLLADYDAIAYGKKTYCAKINESSVEVTEIDFISETSRTYILDTAMPSIVSPVYNARMTQNTPYLMIDGRNPQNGANISFTINLINGENNSTFAQDGRNVVSFFRIN